MPQLKVIPQQSPQIPGSLGSPSAGPALEQFGAQVGQLGKTLDAVTKYRAEQAAVKGDQELAALQQEISANPNNLLDPAWKANYDDKANAIKAKYADTPFIRPDTFENKFNLASGARELQLNAQSIGLKLESGKAALAATMTDYADKYARANTDEERNFWLGQVDAKAQQGVADGLVLKGTEGTMIREVQTKGITAAFERANNQNPLEAIRLVKANDRVLTVDASEKLVERAVNQYTQNMHLELAIDKENRAREKEVAKKVDQGLFLGAVQGITSEGGYSEAALQQALNSGLSPEHGLTIRSILEKNPTGKQPPAKFDDPQTHIHLDQLVKGAIPPDTYEDGSPKPVSLSISEAYAQRLITTDSNDTFSKLNEATTLNPVLVAVGKTVEKLVVGRADKTQAGIEAKAAVSSWYFKHPDATPQQLRDYADSTMAQYDVFNLREVVPSKLPSYYKFEGKKFSFPESLKELTRQRNAGELRPEEAAKAALDLNAYKQGLDARDEFRQQMGGSE